MKNILIFLIIMLNFFFTFSHAKVSEVIINDMGNCDDMCDVMVMDTEVCVSALSGSLNLNFEQSSCTDNSDGTFTAIYDLMLNWDNPPATGDLTLTSYGDGTLNTTTVSAATIAGGNSTTLAAAFTISADGNGSTGILAAFNDNTVCKDSIGFKAPAPCPNDITPCASTSGCIGGNVFEDFNCNGADDTNEPGVQGIQIQTYDCNNTLAGTAYSDADGDWQVCGLTDLAAYRVEFILPEAIACWATPTHVGSDNLSDVQFLTAPACTQFSVSSPADYCQENPIVGLPCYVSGDPIAGGTSGMSDWWAGFRYNDSGEIGEAGYTAPEFHINGTLIGTTWGSAYHRNTRHFLLGATMKRHSGFGVNGTGAIYKMDDNGTPSFFMDLNTLPGINTGTDTRDGSANNSLPASSTDLSRDIDAFQAVGKVGLGDLELSDDGRHLYTINLNQQTLIELFVDKNLTVPTTANVYDIPTALHNLVSGTSKACGTVADYRPWGLAFHKGILYIGVVCSAETSQVANEVHAYVLSFDPAYPANGFSLVLDVDMGYAREPAFQSDNAAQTIAGTWRPWALTYNDATILSWNGAAHPSPILTDIEIDIDGSFILGFMDRFGMQSGYRQVQTDLSDTDDNHQGLAAGDVLRFCNVNGTLIQEGNAGCPTNPSPPVTDPGTFTPQPEFYASEEFFSNSTSPAHGHPETSLGNLALFPGKGEVLAGVIDPFVFRSGGVAWWSNSNGNANKEYELYESINQNTPDGTFSKAVGLGDIELACNLAPLEIGNYVWCDSLQNGIQDACEWGIRNINISLYDRNGNLVGVTQTSATGQYYFNENNVDTTGVNPDGTAMNAFTGMSYNTQYFLVFGDNQFANGEFDNGSDLFGMTSLVNAGSNDNIDSDVDGNSLTSGSLGTRPNGLPFIDMTTAATGCGEHRFDMGVTCIVPCELSLSYTQSNCVDHTDGTFTATYDLTVNWSGAPSTGDLTLTHYGDGTLNTTTVSAATIAGGSSTTLAGALTVPADGNGNTGILAAFNHDAFCKDSIGFKAPLPCPNDVTPCASTSGCIGGNVFEDFNCNGTDDANEPGVQGIEVQVYDCNNALVGTGYSDSDGDWQVCGLTDLAAYRVEFILPETVSCWATPTHVAGSGNQSDVQFLTAPACTQFSVSSPDDYCQANPLTITNCYTKGNQTEGLDVLVGVNYDESGAVQHLAVDTMIGSTYGLAYQRRTQSIFAAAVLKRKAGFANGKDGILHTDDDMSSIYVLNYSSPNGNGTGTVSSIIDLADYGVDVGQNPRAHSIPPNDLNANGGGGYDYDVFEQVGKRGIGDIDISEDGNTLYIVNINSTSPELIILNVTNPSNPSLIQKVSIPNPGCASGDSFAPWGLKVKKGQVYVGTVCTADASQSSTNLKAYIQVWNGSRFSNLDMDGTTSNDFIPLDYERTCAYYVKGTTTCEAAEWQPWENDPTTYSVSQAYSIPQPILSDIEFGSDGELIVGFMDRLSNQLTGRGPDTSLTIFVWTFSAGDLRYFCNDGTIAAPSYTPESVGSCPQTITPPFDVSGGSSVTPPNRHFNTFSEASGNEGHAETPFGGIGILPGSGQLVFTSMNPEDENDTGASNSPSAFSAGGFRWVDIANGTTQANYTLYDNDDEGQNFAKLNGLGDVEFLCDPAPLEIGNYVWCDSLQNGIQDACERGINAINVSLYDRAGNLVGVTQTSTTGQYYFNENNVDTTGVNPDGTAMNAFTGMSYSTQYFIVFGNSQFADSQFDNGSENFGITSFVNMGSNDNIDSDVDGSSLTAGSLGARPDGLPFIELTTSAMGCGDHPYDMGVTCNSCVITADGLANTSCVGTDAISLDLTPTGTGIGATYTVSVSGGTASSISPTSGTYGAATTFTLNDNSAGGGDVTITITDVADNSCSRLVTVTDSGICVVCPPQNCLPVQIQKID